MKINAAQLTETERKVYLAIKNTGSRGTTLRNLNFDLGISFKRISRATAVLMNLNLIRQEWILPRKMLPGGPLQVSKYTRSDFAEVDWNIDAKDEAWAKALG